MPSKYFLLENLALLFVAMVQRDELAPGTAALDEVTDCLHAHYPRLDRAEVQNVVLEVLTAHLDVASLQRAAQEVVRSLAVELVPLEKTALLSDLARIARADGVVFSEERVLLKEIATAWGVDLEAAGAEALAEPLEPGDDDSPLHHLAFVYLVLAHGTDHEFSAEEEGLVLRKLQDWEPDRDLEAVRTVLDAAMRRYAENAGPEELNASVTAVRDALSLEQRRAVLADMVQVANADGVFLDSEEDLLNALREAWGIDAL